MQKEKRKFHMIQLKIYLETKETGLKTSSSQPEPGWLYLINDKGKLTKIRRRFYSLDQIPNKIRECLKEGGAKERVPW
ncbi:hypothetical protein ES705_33904 [subsurface metagenome]|jgi:hypothetical protein